MEYFLETDVANFEIRKEPLGMWDLWVDGMPTITFDSPESAAQAVFNQRSGYVIWDQLESHEAPESIEGWTQKS
ncbi:MAG: hypothetical protein AAGB35_06225 [Pseudomonadota bacterium]